MSLTFESGMSYVRITGRDFTSGALDGVFRWDGTEYHNLYAEITSNLSSEVITVNYGSVTTANTTAGPFPVNHFTQDPIDLSVLDPSNSETSVTLTASFYSILNSGDTPSLVHTEIYIVSAEYALPSVYNASVSVSSPSDTTQTFNITFDYYGYYQISENSSFTQSDEDNNLVPQTIYFKIIKEVNGVSSTVVDDAYNLYEGINGDTITKLYTEPKPSEQQNVNFTVRVYYLSGGTEVYSVSNDVSLQINSLFSTPLASMNSISYDDVNQNLLVITDGRVVDDGTIYNSFRVNEIISTSLDPSLIGTSPDVTILRNLSQVTEVDNGDGTFTYSFPYSNIITPNLSNPAYCGFDKQVSVFIDRINAADSAESNTLTIRMLCPATLSPLPSIPVSGLGEMDVSKTGNIGEYSIKFAYHSSSVGSGILTGFANSSEVYRIYREILQQGVVVDTKTEIFNSSIYSTNETDHPSDGTSISWFTNVDDIDFSLLEIDLTTSVVVKYYVQLGISIPTDSGQEYYWQAEEDVVYRTITDSLSSLPIISDLTCSQISDTQVQLSWSYDTSLFSDILDLGSTIRFDVYEKVEKVSTALKFDAKDTFTFDDMVTSGWRRIRVINFSQDDTSPFSYSHTFSHHVQNYYASYAVLITIVGGASFLSQSQSHLSSFNIARLLLKSSYFINFKTINEKIGVLDLNARRNLEFDKNIDQVPFSLLRKSAKIRGTNTPYKPTR